MARHRINLGSARPLWMPQDRRRDPRRGAALRPVARYPALQKRLLRLLGDFRDAPWSLSVDTGEWAHRCPQQLNVGIKGASGAMILELTKSRRRPRNKPRDRNGKRRPDLFYQHTEPFRFNLSLAEDAAAVREMLRRMVAYTAALDQGGQSALYRMEVGEHRELYRRTTSLAYAQHSDVRWDGAAQEVLEVVCAPGETSSYYEQRIRDCRYGSAEYHALMDEYRRRDIAPRGKRHHFRIYRVTSTGAPAWYLNTCYEFTLTPAAVRRLSAQLPGWWDFVIQQHCSELRADPTRQFLSLTLDPKWYDREDAKRAMQAAGSTGEKSPEQQSLCEKTLGRKKNCTLCAWDPAVGARSNHERWLSCALEPALRPNIYKLPENIAKWDVLPGKYCNYPGKDPQEQTRRDETRNAAETKYLEGNAAQRLRLGWDRRVVLHELPPQVMRDVCRLQPQHGLFQHDCFKAPAKRCPRPAGAPQHPEQFDRTYLWRLYLWSSGAVAWQPHWGVLEADAGSDRARLVSIVQRRFGHIVFLRLLAELFLLRRRRTRLPSDHVAAPTAPTAQTRCALAPQRARAPP